MAFAQTLRRRPVLIAAAVAVLAALAWVAFGWFGVHTLIFEDKVDEAAPTFGAAPGDTEADTAGEEAEAEAEVGTPQVQALASGTFQDRSHPTKGTVTVLSDGNERVMRFEEFATDNGPDLNVYLSTASPDAPAGAFDDDFIDLGDLKGNVGAQNYTLPADVDLSEYRTVVVWCVRFAVAFGTAAIA